MSASVVSPARDNRWLETRLEHLWTSYYSDVTPCYPIKVAFGPRARYRYGSIYSVGKQCHILINRLFALPAVPEYVIDATLAHELAHYVHGYGSGLKKLYVHPHRGGVVDKEMRKRGCFHLEEQASVWRRDHWQEFYSAQAGDATARRAEREKRDQTRWEMYLSTPGFRKASELEARLSRLAADFGYEAAPCVVDWLQASVRRNGLSYYFQRDGAVRLHGTLADPIVPDEVIEYELCYWLASLSVGGTWEHIEEKLKQVGVWHRAQRAIQWRRKIWPQYYAANHPLKSK